jgi:putative membrane-bound dehydrogenase-like protein
MGDYPLGVDGKNKFGGKIKYLEKSKPDGPYDKMTVFMDNLGFPTGVFPYRKGVLVTCAPEIFYAEVGKDGKAKKKEVLFTGFKEGNQQHRVNGLTWGIDNWIYGANGDSGGIVKSIKTKQEVNISGRDFRFKVETGEFEAVSGQSQFGRCRDDWGNWFGCNNSNPMFHFVLEDRYLKRNPHVLYPDHRVPVSVKPGAAPVFPISKPLPRFNTPQGLNHFTSACSTIIYRDTLFGKEFEGNMFVSEPVHNLVHREIMKPKGVTFTSERAADEQTSEFLASSDNWFRPAMIQVGPDGALWIADMYRYVIEHPEWIPKDWQKKLDLRAGHDLGRIYRVYPEDKTPREIPRMDTMKIEDLVKQYESPSGWVRDTAQRLLFEMSQIDVVTWRQTGKVIEGFAKTTKSPQARLHALHFSGFRHSIWWESNEMAAFLKDAHPAVRKHAIAIWEMWWYRSNPKILVGLENDEDAQVRQQLAYVLGGDAKPLAGHSETWAGLLVANSDDRFIVAAGLSAVSKENWKYFFGDLMKADKIPTPLFGPMMRLAKVYGDPLDSSKLFIRQLNSQTKLPMAQQFLSVGELLDATEKNGVPLQKILDAIPDKDRELALGRLNKIHLEAFRTIENPKAPLSEKLLAIKVFGRGLGVDREDQKALVGLLTPQTPDDLQGAAIQQLARTDDPRVPGLLLAPWKSYSPALRNQVLDTLFSRATWTRLTLEAIKTKQVPAQEIDAIRRQRLLQHKDAQVRDTASKIFATASSSDRGKLVELYWLQMPEKADAVRGSKLFVKACATCHKLGDIGQKVGPDLASVGDKTPQGLLTAILDPNRALETRYINYIATTKKGLTVTGILTSETSTTITLVANDGKEHRLLRNELEELASTGKSMMPEGLEKDLTPQDVADIIAHVRLSLPAPQRREFPGNTPTTLKPGKDGRLHLLPANGAIYGSTIVLEKRYGNLGYWYKPEDHAIWTVELAKETTFSVWLDYACAKDSAGNVVAIQCGGETLKHKVASTGSWDTYQLQSIGTLRIPAGRHEIVVRPEPQIHGALLDLKAVELRPR